MREFYSFFMIITYYIKKNVGDSNSEKKKEKKKAKAMPMSN